MISVVALPRNRVRCQTIITRLGYLCILLSNFTINLRCLYVFRSISFNMYQNPQWRRTTIVGYISKELQQGSETCLFWVVCGPPWNGFRIYFIVYRSPKYDMFHKSRAHRCQFLMSWLCALQLLESLWAARSLPSSCLSVRKSKRLRNISCTRELDDFYVLPFMLHLIELLTIGSVTYILHAYGRST